MVLICEKISEPWTLILATATTCWFHIPKPTSLSHQHSLALSELCSFGLEAHSANMTSPTPSAPSASTASSASSASSGKQDSHSQATDVGFYRRYHLPGLFAEDYEKYCEGGYHPIDIGDKIAQRFTIVHKLGYGGFATVWLAREEGESRYVALKVVAADYSETYEELPAIATLLEQFPDLFLAELERFHVDSPNGRHLCQIFPVLGPTLHPLTDVFHRLYPEIALDWCRQLVHAVEVMHSHGLCHGGECLQISLKKLLHSRN